MTVGCNIFKDKTEMPTPNYNVDTPVRTAQAPMDSPNEKLPGMRKNYDMAMKHVDRPRRGHDY